MLRVLKVAPPATAGSVVVPAGGPAAGWGPIGTVTSPLKAGSGLPKASRAVAWAGALSAAPAVVVGGCPVKTSWLAVPGATVKLVLVAPASPGAAAVSV